MAHPDNTFKALRGEETFVERWQCRFGWHRWGKWGKPQSVSYYFLQTRRCTDCGIHESKRVRGASSV